MKKRILSAICAFMVLLTTPGVTAFAAEDQTRASDYFVCYDVRCYAEGDGLILVEFDVDATHTMDEVGALNIIVYEQQSNGDYDDVHSFFYDENPGMITTNSAFHSGDVYYEGISGRRYYATCVFYAKDGNTSASRAYSSLIITA